MTDHQDRSIRQSHYQCHLHRHFLRIIRPLVQEGSAGQSGHQDHCRCHRCIGRQSSIGSLGHRCCNPDRLNLPIHLHRCQFHRNKAGRPLLGVNLRCSRDHLHRLIHRRHYHCRRCMVSLCQARFHHQLHRRRHNQGRRRQSIHRHHYRAHPLCPIFELVGGAFAVAVFCIQGAITVVIDAIIALRFTETKLFVS